jgi:hypothetical protein
MRRFKEYDGIRFETLSRDLADIDGFAPLHCVRKKKLALLLIESRWLYDLRLKRQDAVTANAVSTEIRNILGSLMRIATFARRAASNPATESAMLRIGAAGEAWAKHNRATLPSYFHPTRYKTDEGLEIDFGTSDILARFFSAAPDIYEIAKLAALPFDDIAPQGSAIVWLAGKRLPEVYGAIFETEFTTTRVQNPGIEFVQSALRAIKVRNAISDETILSHVKAARRVMASETL